MGMKLSEAIREGAKLRPQAHNFYFTRNLDECVTGSCAMGAAVEAVTGETDSVSARIFSLFPHLDDEIDGNSLYWHIEKMNDEDHLSREAIADAVEGWGF